VGATTGIARTNAVVSTRGAVVTAPAIADTVAVSKRTYERKFTEKHNNHLLSLVYLANPLIFSLSIFMFEKNGL
jgi:hypothetical protein